MFIHHDILYKSISSGFNCQHVFIMILFVIITMIDTFQIHRAQKRIQFFINQSDSDRLSKVNFRINDVSVKSFRIHKNLHPKIIYQTKCSFSNTACSILNMVLPIYIGSVVLDIWITVWTVYGQTDILIIREINWYHRNSRAVSSSKL